MALRILEAVFPESGAEQALAALEDHALVDRWTVPAEEGRTALRLVLDQGAVEGVMDTLNGLLGDEEGFRLVVLPVEATLPHAPENGDDGEELDWRPRISREELYDDVRQGATIDAVFLAMAALSALVAALGLLRNSAAVVIGAMVIAPLLRPNMALSLATTLADTDLAKRASKAAVAGIGLSFLVALATGWALPVDPTITQISSRSTVNFLDLGIALAAGASGALAMTSGLSAGIVGVMVAVALLPPLVVSGLLLGSGDLAGGGVAMVLLGMNLIAINLAGVATFLAQGIRPQQWWDAKRARKATLQAMVAWTVLLACLAVAVWWLR